VYTAHNGNEGLGFTNGPTAMDFFASIDGVGSPSLIKDRRIFRVYVGFKKL
jgi:hypothetical protein